MHIGHGLEPPTMHPPPPHFTHTNFFLNLDMSKTWNEMLTAKNRDELYILTHYRGVPPTRLKLGGRATQTYLVAILV